jgi:hypothetical protein
VTIGGVAFKKQGTTLALATPDADDQIVFGVVADVKEPNGENLFNVQKYLAFFKEQKADAVLVAGDSGETLADITVTLEHLAKSGLPTLVIPGNREPRAEFHKAIEGLAAKYPNLVDMASVRLVKFDDASVVSLPGYYDKRFIHAEEAGCLYTKADVDALAPIVAAAQKPVVLLAHAEPRGTGPGAIDAFADGNAGDKNLTEFLRANPVPFTIGANMQEAGGRAMDIESAPIKEGEAKAQLFLNPGPADTVAWRLNDGGWSYGMAATLTVKGGSASYKMYKAAQLTEAEITEARKLDPATAAAEPAAPAPAEAKPAEAKPAEAPKATK